MNLKIMKRIIEGFSQSFEEYYLLNNEWILCMKKTSKMEIFYGAF